MAVRIGEVALTGAEISARYRVRHPEKAKAFARDANRRARLRDPESVRARERAYYRVHREIIRARQAAFRADRQGQLIALKSRPCMDCGVQFFHAAMEFDHVPGRGEKAWNVSRITHKKSWVEVLAEIAKCDLVCANCHRVRTFERARP